MNRSLYLVPKRQNQRSGPAVDLHAMCSNAIQFHQRGQLAEAERLYRQILDLDPRHADSLHLLGVLAHQVGRDDIAVELIEKAIGYDKRPAGFHSNLGTALQALGRLAEAEASYKRALDRNPKLAEAQMNLGAVLELQGKHEEAEKRMRLALELRPDLAEVHSNLGNMLQAQGKLDEAVASQRRALELKPAMPEVHANLGNVFQQMGRLDEAVASYKLALELKPAMAEIRCNLGNALLAQNKLSEAEICYTEALELKPDYAEGWYNLGNLRLAQFRPDKLNEAVACYQRAIELNPQLAQAHYNLGNTLHTQDKLEEAADSFTRALSCQPNYAEAHYNLGCVLEDLGQLDETLAAMAQAIAIQPNYAQAQFGRALVELRSGQWEAGWRNYEWRWQSPDHNTPPRAYSQPTWSGKKLEAGRLLLWGEQGVGDEIQFAGLIPEALSAGNRVVLDCDARLKPLLARSFPEIDVVTGCGPAEAEGTEISAQLPTGSLPRLFRKDESSFSATVSPYLKADPVTRAEFRERYSDDRKVIGLAWYTKSEKTGRKRSIDLAKFAPLFALPGIRWISLQYGDFDELEQQAAAANAPIVIDRTVDQFADMDRFAAQVAAMDEIVTIDNSTAHLAGALGIPVSLLLPFSADWRWLEKRADSPWYPTLRLFRQSELGDWQSPLKRVESELAQTIS